MRGMTLKDYIVEILSQAVEADARQRDRPGPPKKTGN